MQALLSQLAPRPRDLAANAARAATVVRQHPDVDFVLFPELYLSGYTLDRLDELACPADGGALAPVFEAAATCGTAVVIGFPELIGGGVANSAALIDRDGSLAGVYRKTHLFGDEASAFVCGDSLLVATLAGRRVAPLVCFDVEFPEPARAAARAGAELLVTISANMDPYWADHELATRARALENRLPLLYCNRVGSEAGFDFVGGSRSVGPDGSVLAEGASPTERLLVAPVAVGRDTDDRVDYLRHVRGELPVLDVSASALASGD
jgi:predicted amidohydrolase